jgi:hypothetical protein
MIVLEILLFLVHIGRTEGLERNVDSILGHCVPLMSWHVVSDDFFMQYPHTGPET